MYQVSIAKGHPERRADTAGLLSRDFAVGDYHVRVLHSPALPVDGGLEASGDRLCLSIGSPLHGASGAAWGPWIGIEVSARERRVEITRDPAGLMAAFFATVEGGCLIGDSVPALLETGLVSRVFDWAAFNEYWYLDFCFPPKTIWADVRAVPNGRRATVALGGTERPRYEQVHVPGTLGSRDPLDPAEAPAVLRRSILEATEQSLAVCPGRRVNLLSGGIDSSVVLAAAHVLGLPPDYALTFKSPGEANEADLAALTASRLGVRLEIVESSQRDLLDDAAEIVRVWGQPYGHGSVHAMQTMLETVPRDAVLFSGDGGGEAFVGMPPKLSALRWIAGPIFDSLSLLPRRERRMLYDQIATRSFYGRALLYGLELKAARDEAALLVRSGPMTVFEAESAFRPAVSRILSKAEIAAAIEALGRKSPFENESLFARSLPFWWAPEGVYAKTWRLLDAAGVVGHGPLTAPDYFDAVKRIPPEHRGGRKQALRDAFADVLPAEVVEAPKRGLRPLNRELLMQYRDTEIARIWDGGGDVWNTIFDGDRIRDMWKAHRDGKVFRSNLLYKVMVFRAWCDIWKPEIPAGGLLSEVA